MPYFLKAVLDRYAPLFKKTRVQTPTLLQMEATECGAAALGIILAFYQRHVPLEELRIACGVSRDGSRAINMLKAARRYGLKAQGAKIETEGLEELSFPAIAFWEFNHFLVIEGFSAKTVYLNDPATGPRTVTHAEFSRAFTGIVLLFEPTQAFTQGGQKITLRSILLPRLRGLKKSLLFVIFASLALVIPGIIIPGLSKVFIDDVLIKSFSGWLLPLLWGIMITAALRAVLSWLQQYYLLRLQMKIAVDSSARFVWHVLRLPFTFFTQRMLGDIESRVSANDTIARWLSGDLSTSVVSIISMLFYGVVLFLFDWQLTLIAITATGLNAFLLWQVARGISNNSRRLQQEFGKLRGIEMSGLQAIETLKATGSEDDFCQRFAGNHAKTINSQRTIQVYSLVLKILPQLLTGLVSITVLGLGSWKIMQGDLSVGTLVAFQSLLISFNQPLMTLLDMGNQLQQIRAHLTRVEDVFKHPEDPRFSIAVPESATPLAKLQGKLELHEVCFGYSPLEPPLLKNISLVLHPGQRIAIVGGSGSGKSTLAKVICGLYVPWSGKMEWDAKPMATIAPEVLSQSLAFVDQEIFLFSGSIEENLTMWNTAVPAESMTRAIEDTLLTPVLAHRLHGLSSEVLPAGLNLSGGQRQQLEIARALVQTPTVLVLDEATSALDAATEQEIMENLKKRTCSMLIIAHRLSTIRDCDEIIVMAQGTIVERGTHAQLYQNQGAYYDLLQSGSA
jgi:NHLM bacteriocin system ABC transporter peptidase/ATP-binding protein